MGAAALTYAAMPEEFTDRIFFGAIAAGFKPDERLTVSEWADKHRYLSPKASAEPGPWRTSRVPYSKAIMDALSAHHPAQKVIFMKAAQIAGTEIGNNWIGYVIDQAPGPMIAVLPNERMAERNSKTRIGPLIDESERLRKKVRTKASKDSGDTILTKEFPGGFLALVGANSPANLRMMPCRYAYMDEIDGYPGDVGGEGDSVELVTTRTRTFSRRKIYMCSTPTRRNYSRIEREYNASNQQRYYVPCPNCGQFQTLKFAQLKFEKGTPQSAHYVCEACGSRIEEHQKSWMLENGEWRAENPDADPRTVGFHLNGLYSPVGWFSWADVVMMWEAAQRSVDKLKVFVNTVLAETWEERGEAPDWENIYRRREQYAVGTVPMGGLFLTCGVDVQKDRLEAEVVAWGRNHESWSVDYIVIPGDTATPTPWSQLDALLDQSFPHAGGLNLKIMRAGVDSGYNTQFVYQYCRKFNQTLKVIATKGQDQLQTALGHPRAVEINIAGQKLSRAVKLWPIGVSVLKSELYEHLRQKPPLNDDEDHPHGYCHFPEYGEEYFKMLTAEQLVSKVDRRGYQKREWQKRYDRNEALDCRVIARAVAASLGYDRMNDAQFGVLERQLEKQSTGSGESTTAAPAAPMRIRRIRSRGIN